MRTVCALAAFVCILLAPQRAGAYSVLSHEALIDAAWESDLVPLLRQRFPRASPEAVRASRAYAYGGSLIQDLGYYPFGSKFFSNLVHYVRSGDFVESLIREAQDVNEYAFALGALAHYASDNAGHPIAVNRAVPIIYPKIAAKHGPRVLYAQAPSHHVRAEFAFDVLQVVRGTFKSDVYQSLVGFEVAQPVLERAFRATYGLEVKDVFGDQDLAIGTYRWAVSQVIPEATRIAWRDKREEILAATPDLEESDVVFTMDRRAFEKRFGANYRKPGLLTRILVGLMKIVPKFGPFKPLAFEPLTPETEKLFLESFAASLARYRELLLRSREGAAGAADTDLDTGDPPARGVNTLADETYLKLLEDLAGKKFATATRNLRRVISDYYAGWETTGKRDKKLSRHLAALNATR